VSEDSDADEVDAAEADDECDDSLAAADVTVAVEAAGARACSDTWVGAAVAAAVEA
jgi:hypothetical protein